MGGDNRFMRLLLLGGALWFLLFPALSISGSPDDPCELIRTLGGEGAYQECLSRYSTSPVEAHSLPAPVAPSRPLPTVSAPTVPAERQLSVADLFERVKQSVFIVVAARNLRELEHDRVSLGSAVAVSPTRLYTNCHVVDERSIIFLYQGGEILEARLVASHRETDRCILEVETAGLTPVSGLRDFTTLRVGEEVFTVGAPHGLEHSRGGGMVSGKRQYRGVNIIQTTAPVSLGSSGGGLFDLEGRLIGITSFLLEGAQALNFAIAADTFAPHQPSPAGTRAPAGSIPPFIGR